MKIIIVGCGKIGQKLAEQLNLESDHHITVVDTRQARVEYIVNNCDIMGIVGSGANRQTLIEAGVETADLLIAVTGSDELNLLTCLIAKKTGNCKTIARVRNPEYSDEVELLKDDLGLAMVINPEQTAASEIARILRLPPAIKIDSFAKGRVELLKYRIPEGSVLNNLAVMDISHKLNCDILICGVEREDSAFIPRGNFILQSGDCINIVASPKNAEFFFHKLGVKTKSVKDTIIVGGGVTAVYLANYLLKSGIDVKIIENNPEVCDKLCSILPEASIINADGSESSVLLEEGITYAESFVALTGIDEENIMLSLFAKSQSKAKLITKINRISYNDVVDNLGLDTIIYPKNLTAEHIIKFVRAKSNSRGGNIETMHRIFDEKAEAIEFNIEPDSPIVGTPIERLSIEDDVLIACINRKGKIITPKGKDSLEVGDTVVIVTTKTGLDDINAVIGQRK